MKMHMRYTPASASPVRRVACEFSGCDSPVKWRKVFEK